MKYEHCNESDIPSGLRFDVTAETAGKPIEVAFGGPPRKPAYERGAPFERVRNTVTGATTFFRLSQEQEDGRAAARAFETVKAQRKPRAARAEVRFDTGVYRRSHGAEPRGTGSWGFVMGKLDYEFVDEVDELGRKLVWFAPPTLTFAAARKLAETEARARGVTLVGVAP